MGVALGWLKRRNRKLAKTMTDTTMPPCKIYADRNKDEFQKTVGERRRQKN